MFLISGFVLLKVTSLIYERIAILCKIISRVDDFAHRLPMSKSVA